MEKSILTDTSPKIYKLSISTQKVINIINLQGDAVKTTTRHYFIYTRIAIIKRTENKKFWQRYKGIDTHMLLLC